MTEGGTLRNALDRVEAVQAKMKLATARTDHERKLEIVNLRRELSIEMGRLSEAAQREPWFASDPGLAAEFRARLSAMRSTLALHQSNWPAVSLDEVTNEYWLSTEKMRSASRDFMSWTRAQLSKPY